MSKREDVLSALFAVLAGISGPVVRRNDVLPSRVGAGGMIILRDGEPGDPQVILSPLTYCYEHMAEIEVFRQDGAGAEAAIDTLLEAVGAAIAADRTLGGLCDWVEAEAPVITDLPVDSGVPLRAAMVGVLLVYDTSDPLG